MWRLASNGLAFCRRRVASAHRGAHVHVAAFAFQQRCADARQRFLQVFVNIVAESLERRHVKHPRLIFELSGEALTEQIIQRREKSRQRLARSGRCGNERVGAGLNSRPAALLRLGGRSELVFEPPRHRGMELERLHRTNSLQAEA